MPEQTSLIPLPPAPTVNMTSGGKGFPVCAETLDESIASYTEEQQEVLRFWFDHSRENGLGLTELAKLTGVHTTTLSRVFRGRYGADIANVIRDLTERRDKIADAVDNPDFIMTSLAKRMFTAFDKTRDHRTVSIMWGKKGIGKSTIEREYKRRSPVGKTYYYRCPSHGCTAWQFVRGLAEQMRITKKSDVTIIKQKIISYLSRGGRLLIIDELHQIFLTCHPVHIVRICELLREIYDLADCGLALTGTDVMHKEFFNGDYSDVLGQLIDRGTIQIPLPAKPTQKDIIAFLDHYGLPMPVDGTDAKSLLDNLIASAGLRKLTLQLRDGASLARKREQTFTWTHFVDAHNALLAMQNPK